MEFRLLGAVEAYHDGAPLDLGRRRERCLLGLLLLDVGNPVQVDRLIDLLWDGEPPDTALGQLRVNVSRIRARLEPYASDAGGMRIDTRGTAYVASMDPQVIDIHRFRRSVDEARRLTDPAARAAEVGTALALWRGPILGDVASVALRQRLAVSYDELHLSAVELYLEAELACGRHREHIGRLVELVSRHPLRQRLVGLLMLALYRDRRQPEAIDAYHQLRTRLARELGLDPDPETQRLHEAIIRADSGLDGDQRDPRPHQLPLDTFGFAGRAPELDQLDAILAMRDEQPTAVVISALSGTAGVGKTTLAVHWAHGVADRFDDGQLYVNLRGFHPSAPPLTVAEAVRGFLDVLAVPATRIPNGMQAQIGLYRSILAGKRMLIVLDNALDPEQVRPLLPGAPGCLVLVTSRNALAGLVAAEGAHPVRLGLLSDDEARQLLSWRLGAQRVAAEPAAVDEIIRRCAQLPLALAIVAARGAVHPDFPLVALAAELRESHGSLEAFTGADPATDMRAVFSWSVRALSPGAAILFRLLGLHQGADISAPAAASLAAVDPRQARAQLNELTRAHLLTEHRPGRYSSHDLLRAHAGELNQAKESAGDEQRAAVGRLLEHYLHTAHAADQLLNPHRDPILTSAPGPGVTPEPLCTHDDALAWFAAEHSVLLAALRHADEGGFDTEAWQLAWALTAFFQRDGRWHDWVTAQAFALGAAQRLGDRAGQAHAHRHLGRAQARLGEYDEAQAQFQRALDVYAEVGDRAGQANTHLGLAWLHGLRDDLDQALRHAEQSLALYQATTDRGGQARGLNSVGWHHVLRGDHERAQPFCQRALCIHEEMGDRDGQAETLDSLGYVHHNLGRYEQAAACYERALDLYRTLGDRFGEAIVLQHAADTYVCAGDPAGAAVAWRQALDILEQLNHPDAEQVRGRLQDLDQPVAVR